MEAAAMTSSMRLLSTRSLLTTRQKIVAALKPDGMVVIEGFQEDMSKQIGRPLGHRVNELTRAFDQLRIVYYEDTVGPADWNDGKPAPIVRFIARKQ